MINVEEIGRQIGEEIANPAAPAFYPGGFKPPHRGHLAAAEYLASKPYVEKVNVVIGHGKRDKFDITPEQSKAIWDIYLDANPNPKISVEISPDKSPIKPLFTYFADLDNIGYVAGAQNEIQSGYFDTLKSGGGGEIRTLGRLSPSLVFKTSAFNHSATPPQHGANTTTN